MVSQVGLNQTFNNIQAPVSNPVSAPVSMQNSIFQNPSNQVTTSDYSNDFLMANLDFDAMLGIPQAQNLQAPVQSPVPQVQPQAQQMPQTEQFQPQTIPMQQPATSPQFTGQNELPQDISLNPNETQDNFTLPVKRTNTYAKAGAVVGFLAPVAEKLIDVAKGASLKTALKSKSLLVACPLLAAAGLGIGWFVDQFVNNKRAKAQNSQQV